MLHSILINEWKMCGKHLYASHINETRRKRLKNVCGQVHTLSKYLSVSHIGFSVIISFHMHKLGSECISFPLLKLVIYISTVISGNFKISLYITTHLYKRHHRNKEPEDYIEDTNSHGGRDQHVDNIIVQQPEYPGDSPREVYYTEQANRWS